MVSLAAAATAGRWLGGAVEDGEGSPATKIATGREAVVWVLSLTRDPSQQILRRPSPLPPAHPAPGLRRLRMTTVTPRNRRSASALANPAIVPEHRRWKSRVVVPRRTPRM